MVELATLLDAFGVKASAKSTLKDNAIANAKNYAIFSLRKNNTPCVVLYNYNAKTKTLDKAKDLKNANALAIYAKYLNGDKSLANYIINDKLNYKANAKANDKAKDNANAN